MKKKLNIITGTAISYGLQENTKALNLLFEVIKDNGFQFRERSFPESLIEAGKTVRELGFATDSIYDHYENHVFPVRGCAALKYLKTENVSYKALNIKHTRVSKPTLYKPEFSKEVEKKMEDEILQVLSADSAFQTLTISVDELESEAILIEIASFFKKSISAP
jgi:arsenate reductase-like glutaredoxin family protein